MASNQTEKRIVRKGVRRLLHMARPIASTSGIYHLRRKVPTELRGQLGHEYKRSLKTRDPQEAKRRHAEEWAKSEEVFAMARAQSQGADVLGLRDIHQLAARWFRKEFERLEQAGNFVEMLYPGDSHGWEQGGELIEYQELLSLRAALDEGRAESFDDLVAKHARAALREHGIPMPLPASKAHAPLIGAFRGQLFQLSDMARMRNAGDWVTQPTVMPHAPLATEERKPVAGPKRAAMSMRDLYESYAKEKRLNDGDGRAVEKTLDAFKGIVERFIELCGDLPAQSVSRAVVTEFREKLARMPSKGVGIRGMSASEQIAKAEAEKLPTLSAPTIRNQLRALSAVLSHGQRLGVLAENPVIASGLSKMAAKAANRDAAQNRRRKDYTREELKAIFTSPIYSDAGWKPPRANFGEAWYWMPLLLYYTGARREELAQLNVADVQTTEEGISYLSILASEDEQDGDRSVKTESSRRYIPLHRDLIERGFLSYVGRQALDGRVFPLLKPNRSGYFGANFGKRWAAYLVEVVGLKSGVDPVHGFRHTFKTLARQAGIPEDVQDAITGHRGDNRVARGYGVMPLSKMAKDIERYPMVASWC